MRVLLIAPEFGPESGGVGIAAYELARGLALLEWAITVAVPDAPVRGESGSAASAGDIRETPFRFLPLGAVPVMAESAEDAPGSEGQSEPSRTRAIVPQATSAYSPGPTSPPGAAFGAVSIARHAAVSIGHALDFRAFDLVWAHDWFAIPAAFHARVVHGLPIVLHFHSVETCRNFQRPFRAVRDWEERGAREADGLIAVSHVLAARISREFHIEQSRIRVVHNAASDDFHTCPPGTSGSGTPEVWFAGRFAPQKGPELFLRAAERVRRVLPHVRFVMAGDGPLRAEIERRAEELGLAEAVEFPGWVPRPRLVARLRHAAVLALPSVCEPFGMAAIEAAACGVAPVVTEGAGVTEVLPELRTAPPFSPDALAGQIIDLLRDVDERRAYVARIRKKARFHTWTTAAAELAAALRDVVRKRAAASDASDAPADAPGGADADAGAPGTAPETA